jgi:hypothetical protein
VWLGTVLTNRDYVLRHYRCRVANRELGEEKLEFSVVCRGEPLLDRTVQIPELLLERTERLLASLVIELLIGIRRLSLVLRVFA